MPDDPVLLVTSDWFLRHETPAGHPERPSRGGVMTAVAKRWAEGGGVIATPTAAGDDALIRVHDQQYVSAITSTAGRSVRLDPDTYTSAESEAVARLAAGASMAAVDHALERGGRALAFVRPPGHHAERERAMGFCLYNNVAVAAAHAFEIDRHVQKVAIVDYDVHHGNGTQWMFYDDPRVLYVSTHQYPFYPGTGAASDVGHGDGVGFTFNVPLEVGATDADFDLVFRETLVRVLEAFDPDLLLLSAGYDAHERDPLGGMRVSTAGYARLTRYLRAVAASCCDDRMVVVTEGGYDLDVLDACLSDTLEAMNDDPPGPLSPLDGSTLKATAALDVVRAAQIAYWPTL